MATREFLNPAAGQPVDHTLHRPPPREPEPGRDRYGPEHRKLGEKLHGTSDSVRPADVCPHAEPRK